MALALVLFNLCVMFVPILIAVDCAADEEHQLDHTKTAVVSINNAGALTIGSPAFEELMSADFLILTDVNASVSPTSGSTINRTSTGTSALLSAGDPFCDAEEEQLREVCVTTIGDGAAFETLDNALLVLNQRSAAFEADGRPSSTVQFGRPLALLLCVKLDDEIASERCSAPVQRVKGLGRPQSTAQPGGTVAVPLVNLRRFHPYLFLNAPEIWGQRALSAACNALKAWSYERATGVPVTQLGSPWSAVDPPTPRCSAVTNRAIKQREIGLFLLIDHNSVAADEETAQRMIDGAFLFFFFTRPFVV